MNTLLYAVLVGLYFIMALAMRVMANPHKQIILETTFPADKLGEPAVTAVRKEFKRRLLQIAAIFSLISLPMVWIRYDSIVMLLFLTGTFLSIGIDFYLQIIYIRKMTQVKVNNGWVIPTSPALVDTKLILKKNQKLLSFGWFIPAILITIGGCIFSINVLGFNSLSLLFLGISLATTALFLWLYYGLRLLPVKPLTSDETINQQSNDLMRHHWSVMLVIFTTVMSGLSFLPALSEVLSYEWSMRLTIIFLFVTIGAAVWVIYYLFSLRQKQDQLIAQAKEYRYTDDDQYWKYGIYYNPNDTRLMVPDRIGMNISMNLGRPAGKAIMAGLILFIFAVLIGVTVPMMFMDFSQNPFRMSVTANEVELTAPFSATKEIPLESIESVELIEQLPSDAIRVAGSATENYLTGRFTVDGKKADLLIYRKSQPILKIETREMTYYFTNKDAAATQKDYQKLLKAYKKD